jgi:hypothetical protein
LIFSADKNFKAEKMIAEKPDGLSVEQWKQFDNNVEITKLYVELIVRA